MGEVGGTEKIRQRLIDHLSDIAFSDVTDFVQVADDGQLRFVPTRALGRGKRHAIASIKMGSKGLEIRCYDKNRASYLLIQLLGLGERGREREIEDLGPRDLLLEDEAGGWDGEAG